MNQNFHTDWKQDPRLASMNPEKVLFLERMTKEIQKAPKDQLMNCFFSMNQQAQNAGIIFSDQETALMVEILASYMTPADRGKLKFFHMMAKKLASHRGN